MPNFLVGAALAAGRPLPDPGWRYVRQPLGLIPSARFRAGRPGGAPEFTCAFYDRGRCTIWQWRPGECSAINCRSENPRAGRAHLRVRKRP